MSPAEGWTDAELYALWSPLRREIRAAVGRCLEETAVPAKTEKQRRFFAAEHERVAEGKAPRATKGMSQKQREDFMTKKKGGKK